MKIKKVKLISFSAIIVLIASILFWVFYWNTGERKISRFLEKEAEKINHLTFDFTNEDELVVAYCVRSCFFYEESGRGKLLIKESEKATIDFIRTKKYNKNLYFHFIVSNFKQNDELVKYAVETFIENKKNNSLPYYLAAIYYYNQSELEKAKDALLKANNLPYFDLYETELRKQINKVVMQKTNDPVLPGILSINTIQVDLNMALRRDIGGLIKGQEGLNEEMHRALGVKLFNNSTMSVDKMFGNALRKLGLDKNSIEYKLIREESERLPNISLAIEIKDFEIFKEYCLDLIKVGETQALINLSFKQ